MTPTVQALTEMVGVVGKLPGPMRTLAAAAIGLGAAFVTASGAASALGLKLKALVAIAGKVALLLGPIVGVALAIEDARLRKEEFDKALESTSPTVLQEALDKATKELDQLNIASKKFEDSPYYKGKIQDVNDLKEKLDEAKLKVEELTKRRSLIIDLVFESNAIAEDVRRQTATGRPGGAGFDTLTPAQLDEALGRSKPKSSSSSTGSTAKGPQDISAAMETLLLRQQELRFSNDQLAQSRIEKEIQIQSILESQSQPRQQNIALIKAENDALFRTASIFAKNFKEADDANKKITASAIEGVRAGFAAAQEIDAELQAQAEKMNQLYSSIGQTITTGIVDSLTAAVDGTKSLAEVASNTLKSLANILLKFGINSLLGGLGGGDPGNIFTKLFGGARASGGSVSSSKSYLVGERGPELFTPGRSGSIAPNGSLGGSTSVTVNVDASGSSVEGDSDQASQLGKMLGAAVQAELIKQKRPGGLLSS